MLMRAGKVSSWPSRGIHHAPTTELVGTQHSLLTTTISLTRFEQPLSPAANE